MSDQAHDAPRQHAARIEALEIRVAHQDLQLAELNQVITEQWRKIDHLARQLEMLRADVQNMPTGREGPEPPPPHY